MVKQETKQLLDTWEVKPLRKIGNIFSGNSINAKVKEEKYLNIESGIPYVATKDVSYNYNINYDNNIKIPENEINNFKIAHKNSILICAEGGSAGRKLSFNTQDICFVNKLFALEPFDFMNPKYIFYFYQTSDFQKQFKSRMTGLIGGVSMGKFKTINVPIPPLPIQKQIVKILDETFEKISKAKENSEKNLKNAKEVFESYLQSVFEKKGEGWEEKYIQDLGDKKNAIVSGPFGSNLKVTDYRESGTPIVRLQNIGKGYFIDKDIKYISQEKAEELKSHSFVSGDLILAKLGIPVGKTCKVPDKFKKGIIVADVVRIRLNNKLINYNYLLYYLNTNLAVSQLSKNISGATRPRVNLSNVREIKISLPNSLDKQNQIVLIFNKLLNQTKQLESIYTKKLSSLEELKQSILQKAFEGKLIEVSA